MVVISAACISAPVAAQARVCDPQDTLEDCFNKYYGGKVQATGTIQAAVEAKPTGVQATETDVESSVRNFLPRLQAALLNPGLTTDRQALNLKLNGRLDEFGIIDLRGPAAQFEFTVNEPKLYGPLVDSIPQERREASRQRLEKTLEDLDDFTLALSLNKENRVFGRHSPPHAADIAELFGAIVDPVDRSVDAIDPTSVYDAAREHIDPSVRSDPACNPKLDQELPDVSPPLIPLRCIERTYQDSVFAAFNSLAVKARGSAEARANRLTYFGFDQLPDLLNNQPQFTGTLSFRTRDDIAGPSELNATLRIEGGISNLNRLRQYCSRLRPSGTARDESSVYTPECLYGYLNHPRRIRPAVGARGWASLSFGQRLPYRASISEDTVSLRLGRRWTSSAAAGYGRYFGIGEDGKQQVRVDVNGRYERSWGDDHEERITGTVTYTQRFTDQAAAVLGVTFVNKPEFLGEVGKKARANLGITYKILPNSR
jgi:hypothetical protein